MKKIIQAKHIETSSFLELVASESRETGYASLDKLVEQLGLPEKVVLAKLRQLEKRGKLTDVNDGLAWAVACDAVTSVAPIWRP